MPGRPTAGETIRSASLATGRSSRERLQHRSASRREPGVLHKAKSTETRSSLCSCFVSAAWRGRANSGPAVPGIPGEPAALDEILAGMSFVVQQGVQHLVPHNQLVLHIVSGQDNPGSLTGAGPQADLFAVAGREDRDVGNHIPLDL